MCAVKNKTQKEEFFDYLRENGYKVVDEELIETNFIATLDLVPHYYISDKGSHILVSNISIVDFGGSNTKDGDLGCVCFHYGGLVRLKHKHRRNAHQEEVLKKSFCPKTVKKAIETFEQWHKDTAKTLNSWRMML